MVEGVEIFSSFIIEAIDTVEHQKIEKIKHTHNIQYYGGNCQKI
jgi:hypothetical protein